MKKFIDGMKIGLGILVVLFAGYYLVNARSGLTASPGDKLTSAKWNDLVTNLSGNATKITSVESKFTGENRIDATLQNGRVNFGTRPNAGYYKDSFGIVHLRGLIKSGPINTVLFNLPVGYRPSSFGFLFPTMGNDGVNHVLVRVDVGANGNVSSLNGNGSTRLTLDGISFRTY